MTRSSGLDVAHYSGLLSLLHVRHASAPQEAQGSRLAASCEDATPWVLSWAFCLGLCPYVVRVLVS